MSNCRNVILDASAFIAFLDIEKGHDVVENIMHLSVMSLVNISEVAKFLINCRNYTLKEVKEIISQLIQKVVIFREDEAYLAAQLYSQTKEFGLSFADRACLALGIKTGYPIFTADRVWGKLKVLGAEIHLIR